MKPSDVIHTVSAKTEGEVLKILMVSAPFLRHVGADPRTRKLFARWRRDSKLDLVVAEWSGQLDAAAARAGLAHRSVFHHDDQAYNRIPIAGRTFFAECEQLCQMRRERTLEARAKEVDGFISTVLYDHPPPFRGWLGAELLTLFDAEIIRDIWGEPEVQMGLNAGTVDVVKKGQRPKGQGEHLERYAEWYYRACVKVPRTSVAALAHEDRAAKELAGVSLAPKDTVGITERADTSLVRSGIDEARRLLELHPPPEQWLSILKELGLIVGGKTH